MSSNATSPKALLPLAYFSSDPSIVLSVCVPVFKEPRSTLFHTSSTKVSCVFKKSRRLRITSIVSLPFDFVCDRLRLLDFPSHRFSLRRVSLTVVPVVVLASLDTTPNPFIALPHPEHIHVFAQVQKRSLSRTVATLMPTQACAESGYT